MTSKENIKNILFNYNEKNVLNSSGNNNENKSINFSDENKNKNNNKSIIFLNKNEKENEKEKENENKSINFSNNNNENESINFSNIEEGNNITKFLSGDQKLVIEEEVAIKEEDLIYKNDIVYLKELENQLLSEYPITKQKEKFIQTIVDKKAKQIIDIKNIGLKVNDMLNKNIEYNLINEIINDNYIDDNILPIILDKHKIYVKLEEDQNENIESSFSESFENKEGIIEINQKSQMIELKDLNHKLALEKISYKDYLNEYNNITKAYDIKESNFGIIKKYKNHNNLLRYYDYNTIYWDSHKDLADFLSVRDIFNETGKLIGSEPYTLVNGNNINIVGYMCKKDDVLKKEFKQRGIISKIVNSTSNNIKVEIKNHGLNEKDQNIVYIDKSNSFPKINNLYLKSVKIIDKDHIEINIHEKLLIEGNYGILYTLSKLEYDLYHIEKEDNIIKLNKKRKIDRNNIYLFDKININKNDFESIIKIIVPSLNEIIEENLIKLKGCYTYYDVDNILKKYYININTLHIEQVNIIKDIFKFNLNKIIIDKDIKKINLPKFINSKYNKYLNDNNYFLSDKYITDKELTKYYTKYIHLNQVEDNLLLRLKWLLSQKDNGEYFFNTFSQINIKHNKSYIKNKINDLTDSLEKIKKNFKREKYKYNFEAIPIDSEFEVKKLNDNTNVFYKNDLYIIKSGKLKLIEDIEEDSHLLVEKSIWIWKKNKWEESKIEPKYNSIKYLCYLNNVDISDLNLDSLDRIYRKDKGCISKSNLRLEETIVDLNENISNFQKLLDLNDKDIKEKINLLKEKYYDGRIIIPPSKEKIKSEKYNLFPKLEPVLDNLSIVLNLIKQLDNYNTKLNYIYMLIEKDGILIDKDIYSKKYLRKMNICGHYIFFKKINYSNDPNVKIYMTDIMLSLYGNGGETDKDIIRCKHCGETLVNNEYDETEGFSETGMIKKSRELWSVEIVDKKYDQDIDLLNYIKSTNIEDKAFKEILIKHGISIEDVEDAIKISIFIVKNLYSKAGIILPNSEFISVIVDSMQKIKRIIPYRIFRLREIKKYQQKGFSQDYIDNLESKNIFKNEYIKSSQIKKNCIISARFLISVQISVPALVRSSKYTICPFLSFYGNDGISYMACILEEMQLIEYSDKTKIRELIKLSLEDEYNEFKKLQHIQKLFKIRKEYELELSKKIDNFEISKEIKPKLKTFNENNNINYNKEINRSKNIQQLREIEKKFINKLKFITYSIINIVNDVIAKSVITDPYIGLVEVSCCTEYAKSFMDYYFYIEEESKVNIKKLIDESHILFKDTFYFINTGSIHKFRLYNPKHFDGIYNNIIIDNDETTSEDVIKAVFEFFVDSGTYAGTRREYIGDVNNPIDFKSGLSKKEILSRNYTIHQYRKLLYDIEKHNIKYYYSYKKEYFNKTAINEMKKTSYEKLNNEIDILINSISTVLNKDAAFKDKYINLVRNMGIFNIEKDIENMSLKEKIKYRENLNATKTDYIKKFYICKLKKYLSIIKNFKSPMDIKVNFIEDEKIALEIQKDIFTENKKLDLFLNESIRKYFLDLNTKYSNDEINSIIGKANIYNNTYENIIEYSDFNYNDASNVLLYLLISELNGFIYCKSKNNSNKCKYICFFILILLEEIENEDEIFNKCETDPIKNSMIHQIIEYKSKNIFKKKEEGISLIQSLLSKTKSIDYLGEKLEEYEIENQYNEEYSEKINYIRQKGKEELFNKLGYEPSEEELETYKSNYLEDMQEAEKVNYFETGGSGREVLDQGADYGDLNEFDYETGEGFDYSDQMEY